MNSNDPNAEPPPEAPPGAESIDFEKLNAALRTVILAPATSDSTSPPLAVPIAPAAPIQLEDLAGDLLHLMHRVHAIEEGQAMLLAHLGELRRAVDDSSRAAGRELAALRHELLGEQKALANLHVFRVLAHFIDSLDNMRKALTDEPDSLVARQLHAILSAANGLLLGLGFVRFAVAAGQPFDPARMECAGFAEGEAGTVLGVVRNGYQAGQTVVRPAGVLIAKPRLQDTPAPAEEEAVLEPETIADEAAIPQPEAAEEPS